MIGELFVIDFLQSRLSNRRRCGRSSARIRIPASTSTFVEYE